jgi:uncharacterized protein (DUF3820 family)
MDGDSIMPFGKYKGDKLSEVPDSWFIFMYDRKKLSGELKSYAESNVRLLAIQARQTKEKKNPE